MKKIEIKDLETILQDELFALLIGENSEELYQRLQAGTTIENNISQRIIYLNKMVEHLQGGYNNQGIRDWFYRERTQLGKKNPLQYLSSVWNPNDENAKKVLELAKSLNR